MSGTSDRQAGRVRAERLGVAGVGLACASIVLVLTWAVVAAGPDEVQRAGHAPVLGLAALLVAAAAQLGARRLPPHRAALMGVVAGAAVVALLGAWDARAAWQATLLPVVGLGVGGGLRGLAGRLPIELDGAFSRRPARAWLWTLLAVLLLAQTVRFSAFMADARLSWGSVVPFVPQTVRHMCLAAYLEAADLARQGRSGIYDPESYRPPQAGAAAATSIVGIAPYLEDPFLYAPPFLLLPRLALALSTDYRVLRTVQYALQAGFFTVVALGLAAWTRGRAGRMAGLLLPAMLASTPIMFNLQYGQAQLAVSAAAIAGMLLIERGRNVWGGLLLAFATLAKIFPGVLLVLLLAQRRWRALAWCAAGGVAWVLLSRLVFGAGPFVEYFQAGHVANVASGKAVRAFEDDFITVVNNISAYSLVLKLRYGGLPGMSTRLAESVSWAWSLLPVGLALWAGRRRLTAGAAAVVWLALLNLGAMRSPNAPAVYTLAGTLWLLTLLAHRASTRRGIAGIVACWVLCLGLPPMPARGALVAASLLVQAMAVGLNLWAVARPVPPPAMPAAP